MFHPLPSPCVHLVSRQRSHAPKEDLTRLRTAGRRQPAAPPRPEPLECRVPSSQAEEGAAVKSPGKHRGAMAGRWDTRPCAYNQVPETRLASCAPGRPGVALALSSPPQPSPDAACPPLPRLRAQRRARHAHSSPFSGSFVALQFSVLARNFQLKLSPPFLCPDGETKRKSRQGRGSPHKSKSTSYVSVL